MATATAADLELDRLVLEQITGKWTLLILASLCAGPMRFNALRRSHATITQKALTQCLRRLEANGFVERRVLSTAPVAVAYEISALGRSLEPHLQALLAWTKAHRDDVAAAQEAFAAGARCDP